MREQYPFFRDADERTRAVIGGEAADADLNGSYQKPYAILSDRRLYCKNEQGNFIVDSTSVRMTGREKAKRPWMVLVSALLLFSILITLFADGSALSLLTFRTQRAAGEAAKLSAVEEEVDSLWREMDLPYEEDEYQWWYVEHYPNRSWYSDDQEEEKAPTLADYLGTYSAKELRQIYSDCGLDQLPSEQSSALDQLPSEQGSGLDQLPSEQGSALFMLNNAETFLLEARLASLAAKFDWYGPEDPDDHDWDYTYYMNHIYSDLALFYYAIYDAYAFGSSHHVDTAFSPEDKDLFVQYYNTYKAWKDAARAKCNEGVGPGTVDEQYQNDFEAYYVGGYDVSSEADALFQANDTFIYKLEELLGCDVRDIIVELWSWFYLNSNDLCQTIFCESYDYGNIGGLATGLAELYDTYAGEQITPEDFLTMLEVYIQLLNSESTWRYPWDYLPQEEEGEPAEESNAVVTLEQAQAEAILRFSEEDREHLLLPLSQIEEGKQELFMSYIDKLDRFLTLRDSSSYEVQQLARGDSPGGLRSAALFTTLCAWAALIGGIALLVLFVLNLGKLAGLAGAAAGIVCILCGIFGDPSRINYYYNLPSMFTKWFPAAVGLAVVVLCVVTLWQFIKKEAVPTFHLITSAGTFTFREKDYPREEREAFAAAIAQGEVEG